MAKNGETLVEDDEKTAGEGAEELIITEKPPVEGKEGGEDPRPRSADEQDINPDDPDGHEKDDIRERRRLERLERKERREKAINRDKIELEFLRKRNDDLERRVTVQESRAQQQDMGAVDQGLTQAQREVEMAETVIAKAVAAGNGDDVIKAMKYRDEARVRAQQLEALKRQRSAPPAAVPGVAQAVVDHAREFMEDNIWYNPAGTDEDSAIVLAIDQSLAREGLDPRTEDYWDELRTRVERRLPERARRTQAGKADAAPAREARGGPAIGSGKEHAPQSSRREVYISPERKQALIEAGVWDDPVLRMKYVKRYSEYDKANRA